MGYGIGPMNSGSWSGGDDAQDVHIEEFGLFECGIAFAVVGVNTRQVDAVAEVGFYLIVKEIEG